MTTLSLILMFLLVAFMCVYSIWTERKLYEERTKTAILQDHEQITLRLLVAYYQKIFFDKEKSYVDKEDLKSNLLNVITIYDFNAKHIMETFNPVHAATGAAYGEDSEGV